MSFARNMPIFLAVFLAVFLAACATSSDPVPLETVGFLDRSVTQQERGVTVSAAVPNSEETRDLFGIALYKKDVQPIWLSIRNETDRRLIYMPAGTDVDYHSPFKVAAFNRNSDARARLEQHFFDRWHQLLGNDLSPSCRYLLPFRAGRQRRRHMAGDQCRPFAGGTTGRIHQVHRRWTSGLLC